MKARKLDLTSFSVKVEVTNWQAIALELADGRIPQELLDKHTPPAIQYPLRDNLADLLFSAELGLRGRQTLEANEIAQKILAAPNDFLLLTEAEYDKVARLLDIKGYRRIDIPLLERLKNISEIEVEEKKDA